MIAIDGKNILTEWTLEPVRDAFYNPLMRFPDLKDRITNDRPDRNGIDVLLSTPRYKEKEMSLSFFCDTYAAYKAFIAYLKAHQNVYLYDSYTDNTYTLEYLDCSSLSYYRNYSIFAIKVRENNPTSRSIACLGTSTGAYVITSTGLKIKI